MVTCTMERTAVILITVLQSSALASSTAIDSAGYYNPQGLVYYNGHRGLEQQQQQQRVLQVPEAAVTFPEVFIQQQQQQQQHQQQQSLHAARAAAGAATSFTDWTPFAQQKPRNAAPTTVDVILRDDDVITYAPLPQSQPQPLWSQPPQPKPQQSQPQPLRSQLQPQQSQPQQSQPQQSQPQPLRSQLQPQPQPLRSQPQPPPPTQTKTTTAAAAVAFVTPLRPTTADENGRTVVQNDKKTTTVRRRHRQRNRIQPIKTTNGQDDEDDVEYGQRDSDEKKYEQQAVFGEKLKRPQPPPGPTKRRFEDKFRDNYLQFVQQKDEDEEVGEEENNGNYGQRKSRPSPPPPKAEPTTAAAEPTESPVALAGQPRRKMHRPRRTHPTVATADHNTAADENSADRQPPNDGASPNDSDLLQISAHVSGGDQRRYTPTTTAFEDDGALDAAAAAEDGLRGGYGFGYTVLDESSGTDFGQWERREPGISGTITGQYRVRLPDGRTQTVEYHVGPATGYRASVTYEETVVQHQRTDAPPPPSVARYDSEEYADEASFEASFE